MQTSVRTHLFRASVLAVAAASALVAGCGGGSSGAIPLPTITAVKVMGDSLADVGTFGGLKFTVQGTTASPLPIFTELVAQSYGLTTHCNFYTFTGTTFAANSRAGCTNFAIGGGRINGATGGLAANDPRIVVNQLQTAVAAGNHTVNDLLMITGGGNDAADVIGLYLSIGTGGAAAVTQYATALKTVLPAADVDSRLSTAQGLADLGGLYMKALATRFYDQIKANALDRGARYVTLVNMPAVTLTPRFRSVLAAVAAANGGGTTGATASATAAALFDGWASAFNTELASKFNGNANVLIVDINTSLKDQVARPQVYGLGNVTEAACTEVSGLDYSSCTPTVLDLLPAPAAGVTNDRRAWRNHLFSDSFHPTPYAHQLAFQQIRSVLFNNSWQ